MSNSECSDFYTTKQAFWPFFSSWKEGRNEDTAALMRHFWLFVVVDECVGSAVLKKNAHYRTNLKSYSIVAKSSPFRGLFFANSHNFSDIADNVHCVMDQKSPLHVEHVCKSFPVHFECIASISLSKEGAKIQRWKRKNANFLALIFSRTSQKFKVLEASLNPKCPNSPDPQFSFTRVRYKLFFHMCGTKWHEHMHVDWFIFCA